MAICLVVISVTGTTQAAPINNEIESEPVTETVQVVETDPPAPISEPLPVVEEEPVAVPKKVVSQQPEPVPQPKLNLPSDKQDLMRLVGIPEYEWAAVNEILSRESGWNHLIWNRSGSGAYGLCQSLPASKMASAGADYLTNPVTQLKWCNNYAKGYGGWIKAAQFSRCIGSCFSTRTNSTVYKDHKWW